MKVGDKEWRIPVSKKDIAVGIKTLRNAVDRYKAKRLDTNFSSKLSDNSGVGIWRTKWKDKILIEALQSYVVSLMR